MSWNGSSSPNAPSMRLDKGASRARPTPSAALSRGLVAGLIVVALGGAAVWWFFGRGGDNLPEKAHVAPVKAKIAEATPNIVSNKVDAVKETPLPLNVKRDHSELSREDLISKVPHWAYSVEDRKRVDPGYEKKHERFLKRQENNPWKTYADNALAILLFSDGNLGWMPPFNATFKNAFLKSIETPIVVSKDDPPELQEQKRQLIETKIWLKDQIDDGKDIVQLLNDEYNQQKKIAGLRDNLKKELLKLQKTAKSVEEVEDYVAAANQMLKDAGASTGFGRSFSTMTKFRLKRETEAQSIEK